MTVLGKILAGPLGKVVLGGLVTGVAGAIAEPLVQRGRRFVGELGGFSGGGVGRVSPRTLSDASRVAEAVAKGAAQGALALVAPAAALATHAVKARPAPAAPPEEQKACACQTGGAKTGGCACQTGGAETGWFGDEARRQRDQGRREKHLAQLREKNAKKQADRAREEAKQAKAEAAALKDAEARRLADQRLKDMEARIRASAKRAEGSLRRELAKRAETTEALRRRLDEVSAEQVKKVATEPPEWLNTVLEKISQKEGASPGAAAVMPAAPPPFWYAPPYPSPYAPPPASPYPWPSPQAAAPVQQAAADDEEIDPMALADLFAADAMAGIDEDVEELSRGGTGGAASEEELDEFATDATGEYEGDDDEEDLAGEYEGDDDEEDLAGEYEGDDDEEDLAGEYEGDDDEEDLAGEYEGDDDEEDLAGEYEGDDDEEDLAGEYEGDDDEEDLAGEYEGDDDVGGAPGCACNL
ncbi:hypothetical protein [Sorangium sp. So ce131]|uniref:hypothetical protein n=1 Tax=Sorangium sp. So ce131 TaxID=3133282 RepID=UPI003F61FE38